MMVDLEDLGTTHIRRKSISCRKQKDTMKDREGLKSTISSGHGEGSRGAGRSFILDESDKYHGQKIDGIRYRKTLSGLAGHDADMDRHPV
jgi:hypothetical protein